MKYPLNTAFFILALACFLGFSAVANAQIPGLSGDDVDVQILPENPGPNDTVYVFLTSSVFDINSASITYKINGKTISKAVGQKTFQFQIGDMNTTTSLDITVVATNGETVTNSFKIKPASVDLVWQSGGFVPPFYKGKSMYAHQDQVTFVAIPHLTSGSGAEISPKNLIYKWTQNGKVMESDSGYGKSSFTTIGSLISRPLNIEVEVSSPSNTSVGYTKTYLAPIEPLVVFYKKDPLYGIEFQDALSDTESLKIKEMSVVGMPFFFGVLNPQFELAYKWSINGVLVDSDTTQTTRVFRQNEGVSGTSKIGLSIEHSSKMLQTSSADFNLMFGQSTQ